MKVIEFNADVKNGMIVLPLQFKEINLKSSKIIILYNDSPENSSLEEKKNRMRNKFLKLQELNPFRELTDPVEWQKKLRDDWERSFD